MKRIYLLGFLSVILLTACSKTGYFPPSDNVNDWMRTHEKGIVAYVDYSTGNYIVDTYSGFAVIEYWGGRTPRKYDEEYAYFSYRGMQTIYNWHGDYFTQRRIADYWLTWSEALYIIDQLRYYR